MFAKTALIFVLAGYSTAAPVEPALPRGFTLTAIRSGDINIHQHAVNVTEGAFWIGKPTKASCPSTAGAECAGVTVLNGVSGAPSTAIELFTRVPGGQIVYIDVAGGLRYTLPGNPTVPAYSDTTDFQYVSHPYLSGASFTYKNEEWIACPVGGSESMNYKVYAKAGSTHGPACVDIALAAINYNGASAYQYDA